MKSVRPLHPDDGRPMSYVASQNKVPAKGGCAAHTSLAGKESS